MRNIVSSDPARLCSKPKCDAGDRPANSATGTAKISGQEAATTSTATARVGSPFSHPATAMGRVTSRKPSDHRPAIREIGALDRCASSNCRAIPE